MKQIFSEYYLSNRWKNRESKSGPGSSLKYTEHLRQQLPQLFEKFSVKSVLDAPCGDFNWMQHVVCDTDIRYIGADIVEQIVEDNQRAYGSSNISFRNLDIIADALPDTDLMICRDCLFHLSNRSIWKFLRNFASSNIPLLLTTTHINNGFDNSDTTDGGYRLLDLLSEPFHLAESQVKYRVTDWIKPHVPREMILFDRVHIVDVVNQKFL